MTTRRLSSADLSTIQFRRSAKKKVTPSLYDGDLVNRTYWGREDKDDPNSKVDPGTLLIMALMRSKISKSIRTGYLIDINNHEVSNRLSKPFKDELRQYQLEMISIIYDDAEFEIILDNDRNQQIILK